MRISQKLDYAQRAVACLSQSYDGKSVLRTDDIAEQEAIPSSFLVQILADLKRAGIVTSKRGKAGGYLLARAPGGISFADVIEAVEPQLLEPVSDFEGRSGAALTTAWQEVAGSFERQMRALTYEEVIHSDREPMWFI